MHVTNSDIIGSVSYARKFHQFLIVGLIEACKGILELFPDVLKNQNGGGGISDSNVGSNNASSSANGSSSGHGSSSSNMTVVTDSAVVCAIDAYNQLQVG